MQNKRHALWVGEAQTNNEQNQRYGAPYEYPTDIKDGDVGEDNIFDIVTCMTGRVHSSVEVKNNTA